MPEYLATVAPNRRMSGSVARTLPPGSRLQATGLNERVTLGSGLWASGFGPARVSHCERDARSRHSRAL